ncbi:amyloid beta A4 precursor protein-binding family B member 1-interacting protein-like isoform X2 [Bolinopsis microptera]|uniref:amyloid beta A4 precursor protein-binding family B member 1-interacting protein-like isoform X2 n=1 Tax=Bolinopsis microptera TaxID=2820187 RepID=UPI0030790C31
MSPAPVSPALTPPPPCSTDNTEPDKRDSRPGSMVSEGRPASSVFDQRTSVCTTSSGASSHSNPSSGNNGSMYTMSTTPHSTISKSSGVSSYLTSSSSELYDSKMSLNSTTTDFRENDFKTDPMNVPIRVPDNEPFFNDPEPSPTTPITPGPKSAKIQRRLTMILKEKEDLTEEEKAAILKKEKLKIALEKLKIASNLKIAMKVFNVNNSSKTIWVEQKQTAWEVCQVLAEKNYYKPGSDWTLVEHITDLEIERELEDHEIVYDVLNSWSRDSTNKMYFRNNVRKYELFRRPQLFLKPVDTYANVVDLNRECRQVLIDDFFSNTANTRIPSIGLKGVHWLKSGKKSWRKMNFVIRDSGIYYAGKAKNKSQSLPWTCFSRTEENDMFLPNNNKEFKKQHKAPTEYCFLIRTKTNTREQHRSTRCICVENELQFRLWTNALRRLEYGEKLLNNFNTSRAFLEKLNKEQGDDIQRACLSPTLHSSFQFGLGGDDRASIVLPDIDDNAGDIFAARFGAAWNNGENVTIKEAPSLFDINLETDTQGMTMVRLHK